MRNSCKTICFGVLAAFCWLPIEAPAQQAAASGIRFSYDKSDRVVAVTYCGATGLRNAQLHTFPQLERVEILYGTTLTQDDVAYLSQLKGVTEIWMGGNLNDEYVIVEGRTSKLAAMKSLESVFLCKHEMKDEDLEFVAALPKIEYLEFIADANPWGEVGPVVTDRCADHLSRATTLRELRIQGGAKLTDRFISNVSQHLQHLEHLDIDSGELTDDSLRMLANRCTKLKWLDIQSDRFTDVGVNHLARAKMLEMLWLRSDSLTHACVKSVAGLRRLRHLELTVPSINEDGVRVLASLPQLEILALRQPPLTDEQFAMFENHPALESAFINGSELSEERVIEVVATLPKLTHLSAGRKNKRLQVAVNKALSARQPVP